MQKSVEIKSNGLTLRGTMHVPDKIDGKIPIVCIYHGFAGDRIEPHFMYVKLSRKLEQSGIASIRFDFAGSGESDGDFINMTISKELIDAKNILDFAMSQEFADIKKIGVIGFSMGGAVAGMLAGDRKDDIKALCLWAPAGNMKDIIYLGKSEEDIQKIYEDGYSDEEGVTVGKEFFEDIKKVDIIGKAASFEKDVLLLHGDRDEVVPYSISQKYVEVYKNNSVLYTIHEANHTFDSKIWEEEVIKTTVNYFKNKL